MQNVESKNHYSDSFNFRSLSSIHCWYQFLLLTLRAVQNYIMKLLVASQVSDRFPLGYLSNEIFDTFTILLIVASRWNHLNDEVVSTSSRKFLFTEKCK